MINFLLPDRRSPFFVIGLWLLIAFSLAPMPGRGETDPFAIAVKEAPENLDPGEQGVIVVLFSMATGHYLYADKTSVEPALVSELSFGDIVKPAGKEKIDPFMGKAMVYEDRVAIKIPVLAEPSATPGVRTVALNVNYQGCAKDMCFLPAQKKLTTNIEITASKGVSAPFFEPIHPGTAASSPETSEAPASNIESSTFARTADRFGLVGVLAAAFLWGILASLTPCVYPMIPVTVSIIGAGSGGRPLRGFGLSALYVLGMSLTYAVLGAAAAWTGGLFGSFAGHPGVGIGVAALFVVLALGMFDVIHIQVPPSIAARLGGTKSAGAAGVFFTGVASGAVVGPCVGPLLAAVLIYVAGLGSKFLGFLILWTFSLGMGLLFLIVGTFSGALASLPKSGVWMVRLKHFFGVLLLAAAIYYLQPVLDQEAFRLVLGSFLIGLGVFAGAFDPLTPAAGGSLRIMKTAGLVCVILGSVYLALFAMEDRFQPSPAGLGSSGFQWMTDEPESLKQARLQGKPVMIDFRADWCTACRRMEKETFPDTRVAQLSQHFIALKIDSTDPSDPQAKAILEKYGVIGLPTILFLDTNGKILPEKTITQFVSAEELAKRMREVVIELQF